MIIRVKNLRCETVIGVYAQEKCQTQPLVINLEFEFDEGRAPQTDDINDTINYHHMIDKVKSHVESNRFELVERVVEEVGHIVMANDKVSSCRVEIDKPKGPITYIDSFSVSKVFKR